MISNSTTMVGGKQLYDIILKETDPQPGDSANGHGQYVHGGGRPMEVLKQYPGRFASLHVKDEIKSDTGTE